MERMWIVAAGAVLALLIVASVVVSLVRGEAEFDPDSPEAVVQRYLRALDSGDFDAALALWSPELAERCSGEEFIIDSRGQVDRMRESRITLGDVRSVGETTIIEVVSTYTTNGGGIFGPSECSRSYEFFMRRRNGSNDGQWLINRHTLTWDECFENKPEPPATPSPARP